MYSADPNNAAGAKPMTPIGCALPKSKPTASHVELRDVGRNVAIDGFGRAEGVPGAAHVGWPT
jgi:hypothetical protein